MTETTQPTAGASPRMRSREMRTVLASSFIGSTIEYYDFILYATAASIVFGPVFFSDAPPAVGAFLSFVTLAVGYVVRPVGGVIFGHFGDRVGRKNLLILSLVVMGIATALIGILPDSRAIGTTAPILLGALRLVQGVAVGGEWTGAALMAMEHGPKERRGFAASFASAGGPAGAVLATVVVALCTMLTGDQFLEWGWRIPFLLSLVLVVVGLVIRMKVSETPQFQRAQQQAATSRPRIPLLDVLRHYPVPVLVTLLATSSYFFLQAITTVWGLNVATRAGADPSITLWIKAASATLLIFSTIFFARLSDRVGRRPIMIAGAVVSALLAFPLLAGFTSGTELGFALSLFVGNGIVQGALYGPVAAYVSEQFPTVVRYSGASLSYQTASTIGGGFTPAVAAALMLASDGSPIWVGVLWIGVMVMGVVAVLCTSEGSKRDLELADREHAVRTGAIVVDPDAAAAAEAAGAAVPTGQDAGGPVTSAGGRV